MKLVGLGFTLDDVFDGKMLFLTLSKISLKVSREFQFTMMHHFAPAPPIMPIFLNKVGNYKELISCQLLNMNFDEKWI